MDYRQTAIFRAGAAQRRARIEHAARFVVAERGFGAASIGAIARAADCTPRHIHTLYGNRVALLLAVFASAAAVNSRSSPTPSGPVRARHRSSTPSSTSSSPAPSPAADSPMPSSSRTSPMPCSANAEPCAAGTSPSSPPDSGAPWEATIPPRFSPAPSSARSRRTSSISSTRTGRDRTPPRCSGTSQRSRPTHGLL
ncbi:TetR/AcrR family transcriptional regulator [Brevibacterium casei]|nr:TetR/AcrR family transcriptional regulator [Brevibacterium casei]